MNQQLKTISIKEYLDHKGLYYKEVNGELITLCLFNDCDKDSKCNEAHLYFNAETSQYKCHKCGSTGNIFTLAKHLGDSKKDVILKDPTANRKRTTKKQTVDQSLIEKCHKAIPDRIREYLNKRGITDEIIKEYNLGWGYYYKQWWITIPVKDITGQYIFFKLRQDPEKGNDKMTYPKGVHAQIYDWDTLKKATDKIVICEGEFDRLLLMPKVLYAVTSTHGAGTFKKEWLENIPKSLKIYICFDNDKTGRDGALKVAKMLDDSEYEKIYIINLPKEVGEKGDIIDYFIKLGENVDDLFNKYAKEYPEKIDTSKFKELSSNDLIEILELTIKKDNINKVFTLLGALSAYTEDSQLNISFNAPSSTGKSYIPLQIAMYFPKEDVKIFGYCSPTAFFHDAGEWNRELKRYEVDLSRKIWIFLDMPHHDLLAKLRPYLSHDQKEITLKITDKTQKYGTKAKEILLKGFSSVIFCSVYSKIDQQEATRFIQLSPEITQNKLLESIHEKITKECDTELYEKMLNSNPERLLLKERIIAIKREKIKNFKIENPERIERRFLNSKRKLKPRHSRDMEHLMFFIKTLALLNVWFRKRDGSTIIANNTDIEEAFDLWEEISECQELDLSPYVHKIFKEVIIPAFNEKNEKRSELDKDLNGKLGLTRQEVLKKHYQVFEYFLSEIKLRQEIIPMLETAQLITQVQDSDDRRNKLIFPIIKDEGIEDVEQSEERAAIMEYDAGLNRDEAEELAGLKI